MNQKVNTWNTVIKSMINNYIYMQILNVIWCGSGLPLYRNHFSNLKVDLHMLNTAITSVINKLHIQANILKYICSYLVLNLRHILLLSSKITFAQSLIL